MTPETAIFEGLETLLHLARDARAGGGEQDPVAVAGSAVGVFFWGATPVWSRAGTGKGRFEEAGDKACKSLALALRLALGVDRRRYRLFRIFDNRGTLSPAFDKWGTICINSRRALITL